MKNIYKYFFGSFLVAGMKKKRLCEKKKKSCRELEWATAQFPVWVTILELYRDTTFLGTVTRAMTRLATPTIRPWQGCDTATVRHNTALGAATHAAARDTAHAWPWCRACRDTVYNTTGLSHDTAGKGATTRLSGRHNMAPSARCARGLGTVHAGWARVCTWCTQPSFDTVHCFESLFGTLFMSTVHEVFKKKIQIKSNEKKIFQNEIF